MIWRFGGLLHALLRVDGGSSVFTKPRVIGSATFDRAKNRFTSFELLALGKRTGRTINHARGEAAPSGIGFVCKLAPPNWRVAPTFLDTYDAAWTKRSD